MTVQFSCIGLSQISGSAALTPDDWLTECFELRISPRIATSIPGKAEALKRFLKLGK
jgi:hypothetical protein